MNNRKRIELEYGDGCLPITVPETADILSMSHPPALADPASRIYDAIQNPIGGTTLEEIIASIPKSVLELTAAVTVSDNTRPVPYSCERDDGVLMPLLEKLESCGIQRKNITIVIGTGTHVATTAEWKRKALGGRIVEWYRIVDHDCESATLAGIGLVEGIDVRINEQFAGSDLRIATSLAEPHFMAGVSGGAKAICPGIINIDTTRRFHGAEWMGNPNATSLQLKDNPCYRFPQAVARKIGVHFSINCLINKEGKLVDIYAGDLEQAHARAAEAVIKTAAIPCDKEYDIVLTHGGKVAVNHYQAAKAAYGTIPIIKNGGILILAARNGDLEPIGKPEYKKALQVLAEKGPGGFTEHINSQESEFLPDQWQVQKWDQFFQKVGGFENLVYCTTGIPAEVLRTLPGESGYEIVDTSDPQQMVQEAVDYALRHKEAVLATLPAVAVVVDGPYGVPVLPGYNECLETKRV